MTHERAVGIGIEGNAAQVPDVTGYVGTAGDQTDLDSRRKQDSVSGIDSLGPVHQEIRAPVRVCIDDSGFLEVLGADLRPKVVDAFERAIGRVDKGSQRVVWS